MSAANDEWKAENDQLARFIEECCVRFQGAHARSRQLYDRYKAWAEGAGETVITETMFGRRMKTRGFVKKETNIGDEYCWIGIRSDSE